jgi:hypothetical protein
MARVINGVATASLTLPAGFAAGTYTITARYADTVNGNGTVNFAPSTGSGSLVVNPAAVTLSVANAAVTFNAGAQTILVTASVTSPAGVVNEGTVTFSFGGFTATAAVRNGTASTGLVVPAGLTVGTRGLTATFADATNANETVNLSGGSGSGALTVNPAGTRVAVTNISIRIGPMAQETLTAQVSDPSGPVNEGTITFDPANQPDLTAAVHNGIASVTLTLPANLTGNTQIVTANYNDGAGNFTASASGQKNVYLYLYDSFLPSTVRFTADGGQVVTTDLFGIPLVWTYQNTGRVLSVWWGFFPIWVYDWFHHNP